MLVTWCWSLEYFLKGAEAKRVFSDAQTMLNNIKNDGSLQLTGTVGFYRAQSVGDDIEVLDEDGKVLETFYGIRQQVLIIFVQWNKNQILHFLSTWCPKAISQTTFNIHTSDLKHTGGEGRKR